MIEWIKSRLQNASAPEDEQNAKALAEEVEINQCDFETAIKRVQPSSKREGFATVPDVSWDDIGALQNVRDELKTAILVSERILKAFLGDINGLRR